MSLDPTDSKFIPGDPKRTDSERLIVMEVLMCHMAKMQDKQELRISRVEKIQIVISVLMVVALGTEGINLLKMVV